ncbi:SH3 domain-binding glutamic acid-rich-like protein 3 [Manis javanica]|nr:SH3 domain-binding glutamic acid-rich-like protein 3 [Manis javanica]
MAAATRPCNDPGLQDNDRRHPMPALQGLMPGPPPHDLVADRACGALSSAHRDRPRAPENRDGGLHRTDWAGMRRASCQVANALQSLGVQPRRTRGHAGLEQLAPPGAVLRRLGQRRGSHTINPRLFPEQIEYIANHPRTGAVLRRDLRAAGGKARPHLKTVTTYVCMSSREHMPALDLPDLHCWDELVGTRARTSTGPSSTSARPPRCATPQAQGHPKGVLYSHRSTVLHTLMELAPDTFGLNASETVMLIVPMFHAQRLGPTLCGGHGRPRLVLPGPHLDGQSVYEPLRDEKVPSQGVPTVWLMLFQWMRIPTSTRARWA